MSWRPALDGWLSTVRDEAAVAVVLGGGANGLSYVRSLGRRKIPVLLVESPEGFASRSRYAQAVTLRGPSAYPEDWVELLDHVGSRLARRGVLFATNDALVALVSEHAKDLQQSFRFVVPEPRVVRSILDKREQYHLAQEAGIEIPATHFPESAGDIERVAATVRYPCLFKPYESAVGRAAIGLKALHVNSRDELVACFDRFATAETRFMVQEFVPGDDDALVGYLAFWDGEGREHSWLTKQKLRQYPRLIGDGSFQVSVIAPEVADLSRTLLRKLAYRGLVAVEFKHDCRDDTYRLMEINPRTVSCNQLAIRTGIDFPWIVYQHLVHPGAPTAPASSFRPGVKYVNENWDFQAYRERRQAGDLTFWRWIRSLAGARAWAVATPRDPRPFLSEVGAQLQTSLVRSRRGRVPT